MGAKRSPAKSSAAGTAKAAPAISRAPPARAGIATPKADSAKTTAPLKVPAAPAALPAKSKRSRALPIRSSPVSTARSLRSSLETLHALKAASGKKAAPAPKPAPFVRKPVLQELEARLLLSADLNPAAHDTLLATPALQGAEFRALAEPAAPTVVTSAQVAPLHRTNELVFVDTQTPDYLALIRQMRDSGLGEGRQIEFVLIDGSKDGIRKITDTLAQKSGLDAIHIVSHARDGAVQLGSAQLDFDTLVKRAASVKRWGDALTANGDILFYGCDLAATQEGKALVDALARLTGADVAASEDVTGAASKGGDWDLEFRAGAIEAPVLVSLPAQREWDHLLATFTVTNTNDAGAGSLRDAINQAISGANPGADTIVFNIGAVGSTQTINLTSAVLPAITANGSIFIDGWSQGGAGYQGPPLINLTRTGPTGDGLQLRTGNSTVRGLAIYGFSADGIDLQAGDDNVIVGNYIGMTSAGALSANGGRGIHLNGNDSDGNTIGGTTAAERNVIAWGAGGAGINVTAISGVAQNNLIQGNYLGTNVAGTARLVAAGANDAIQLQNNSSATTITNNVIALADDGIEINSSDSNVIRGNLIGVGTSGLSIANAGNASSDGIDFATNSDANTIGGTGAGEGNVFAFAQGWAINMADNAGDTASDQNPIRGNSIYGNVAGAISLRGYANDALDVDGDADGVAGGADSAANEGQNAPTITQVQISGGLITIGGTLSSKANSTYVLDFYSSLSTDPGNQGRTYLGSGTVTTGGAGTVTFGFTFAAAVAATDKITATATSVAVAGSPAYEPNNTSPFSASVAAPAAGRLISGTVYEDVDGDGSVVDPGTNRAAGVQVYLYRDDGDNQLGAGDTFVGGAVTDASGNYALASSAARHWVVVDSKTIAPGAGYVSGFDLGDVWAEQTYASANAANNAAGTTFTAGAGVLYGGRAVATADNASALTSAEHVIRADATGGNVAGVEFGFSFSAIVDTRGDNNDFDAAANRKQQGTLRQFIRNSNAIAGVQTSNFSINYPAGGVQTITLSGATYDQAIGEGINDAVVLDGTTQEGYDITTPRPMIVLNGNGLAGDGFQLWGAGSSGSTIRGFVINNFGDDGIIVYQSANNLVAGNWIGLNAAGNAAAANGQNGIELLADATNNTVGGTTAAERNVISGNFADGVWIANAGNTGNRVLGNYIGTNAAGTGAVANVRGIRIESAAANTLIGGNGAGRGNVVSGNSGEGISIDAGAGTGTTILGNLIGVQRDGTSPLANGSWGIEAGVDAITIGGVAPGAGNVIANNGAGVVGGIWIRNGTTAGVTVRGNSIYGNVGLGIDLDVPGVLVNDPGDGDLARANDGQNTPVLTGVTTTPTTATITGTINSRVNSTYLIDFYASLAGDNNSSGRTHLGSILVATNGAGNGAFAPTFTTALAPGAKITATATSVTVPPIAPIDTPGSTSEFSNVVTTGAPGAPGNTISGTIFEDVNGDSGLGDAVGARNVTVHLWSDLFGAPTYIGSAVTDASGVYTFTGVADGAYGVVVDSKTITPSAGFNVGFGQGNVWAEQTYGVTGAAYWTGALPVDPGDFSYRVGSGAFYGGMQSPVGGDSDDLSTLNGTEHATRVIVSGASVGGIDSAFSFNVVTNTLAGDNADHDTANPRTVQGSLRQFIQNANAIAGDNVMRFVPLGDPNVTPGGLGGGDDHWQIVVTSALPALTDAGTTIDGRAYDSADGVTVRDTNTGTLGYAGQVGLGADTIAGTGDDPTLSGVARPELEIVEGGAAIEVPVGLDVQANSTTIRRVSIHGFGNDDTNTGSIYASADIRVGTSIVDGATGTSLSGTLIEQNIIGVGPSSLADPGVNNRSLNGIGIYGPDAGVIQDNVVASAGQFGIFVSNDADGWTIQRNDIRQNGRENSGRDGMDAGNYSGGALIRQNYIFDNAGSGIDSWQSDGGHTITDNTIDSNGTVGSEESGVRLYGTNSTLTLNRIQNSAGAGVLVVADPPWAVVNFPSNGNRISQNSFATNGANAIDLLAEVPGPGFADADGGDGITLNDGATNATWGNRGVDYPVITAANKVGPTTTITGTAATGVTSVEVYRAVAGAGDTSGGNGYGEGTQYLGTAAVIAGAWTLNFTDGAVTLNAGDAVSAIGVTAANDTSEFGRNLTVTSTKIISGTVFHDTDGDADVTEGEGALAGALVYLFRDGGDGLANGVDDAFVATATTDLAGAYSFTVALDATYWVVVDSKSLHANNGVWAEQTYGDDAATAPLVLDARYGGRNATVSDNAGTTPASLATAEHVARAVVAGADRGGVDFGFSFNVVTNLQRTGAVGDTDHDLANPRTIQGSLYQFIQNANAIAGGNTMRFVPTVAANAGAGTWWRLSLAAALPNVTDALTVIDGTAYFAAINGAVRDTNLGTLGAGGTVGVGAVALSTVERPELEIVDGGGIVAGIDVRADDVVIRDLGMYGFDYNVDVQNFARAVITGTVQGATAAGADPGGAARTLNQSIRARDGDSGQILNNYFAYNSRAGISLQTTANGWLIENNEFRFNDQEANVNGADGISVDQSANTTIRGNLVTQNRGAGIHFWQSGGGNTIVNNTITSNSTASGGGVVADRFGIGLDTSGAGNVVDRNIVSGNQNGSDGIRVNSTNGIVIIGNYVGTDAAGTAALGNAGSGIYLNASATATIGGTTVPERNLISGNAIGVRITGETADSNLVRGNYIGTSFDGSAAIANAAEGVLIDGGADHNVIGGSAAGANVISGNASHGVHVSGAATTSATVSHNVIGTNAARNAPLGNGGDGVRVTDADYGGPGNTTDISNNTIGGNAGDGVRLINANSWTVRSNYIGTDSTRTFDLGNAGNGIHIDGTTAFTSMGGNGTSLGNWLWNNDIDGIRVEATATSANRIEINRTWNNSGLGINLVGGAGETGAGVTPNDAPGNLDADTGANGLQNFPVITAATWNGSSLGVAGTISSKAGAIYRINFYVSPSADASGNGEGQFFAGAVTVGPTNGAGLGNFSTGFAPSLSNDLALAAIAPGWVVTASVWQQGAEESSELSGAFPITISSGSSISGTLYNDLNANANVGDDGGAVFANRANSVRLYLDNGDGTAGAGDGLQTTVGTDAAGLYTFTGLADGTYWVAVDSKALDADNNVWVEQTYGAAGAVRYSGAYSYLATAGAMFGGMEADGANSSDNFAAGLGLAGAEHVMRVVVSGGNVVNRDYGFSANVVTNVLAGDARDDDAGASPRTVQGSLRQFIQNANALAGANAMVFVPAANPNVDGGNGLGNGDDYWRLDVTNALPQITGADTTIDGTAFGFTYGAVGIAVRNDNAGTLGDTVTRIGLGADGIAGTGDDLPLAGVARPELEIADGVVAGAIANGLDVQAQDVTIRDLAIWGFGTGVNTGDINVGDFTGTRIEGNVIGTTAASFTDPGAERSAVRGINVQSGDSGFVLNNLIGFHGNSGVRVAVGANNWQVQGNEIRQSGLVDPTGDGVDADQDITGLSVDRNLIAGNSSPAVHFWQRAAGNTITNNTMTGNAWGVSGDIFTVGFDNPGLGNRVAQNVITGGTGPGVMVRENVGGAPVAGGYVTISRNAIDANVDPGAGASGLGIDLGGAPGVNGDDVTANDGAADADAGPNALQNFPTATSFATDGTDLFVTGLTVAGPGANSYRIEFFASLAADPSGNGEGARYLGYRDVMGSAVFNGTLAGFNVPPGQYVTMTATRTDALAPTQFFETSEFSAAYLAAAAFDISGTIYEDVEGDSVDGVAPADWVGRDNVRVRLFRDGGDGVANGADDAFVASTLTGPGGSYTFANQAVGTYWVVVDSRTITPNAGGAATSVWAEQTSGSGGAWGGGLTPSGVLATSGALYGGRSATNSDNSTDAPGSLPNSDHVTRVTLAASDVAGVDSAFSFNVVTNVRGDGTDDDGANPRLQQGSLHQFILNANATTGANAMVFVPATNPNVDGGNGLGGGNDYWRVTVTSALAPITDAFTTVDGTAYSFSYGTAGIAVRDDNAGLLGAGGTVGVDGLSLSQVARPELEIVDGAAPSVIDYGLHVQAADATIRDLAIYGFGDTVVATDSGDIVVTGDAADRATITGNLVGFSAGAATFTALDADPGGAARTEHHGIYAEDADDGVIQNNLVGFVGFRGVGLRGVTGWTVENNEIRGVGQAGTIHDAIDVTTGSSSVTIEGNLIAGNRSPGIDLNGGSTNTVTVVNNTVTGNATAGSGEEFGIGVRRANNVVVDRNVVSGNTGAGVYVVRDNAGATNALVTGNQITGNTGAGVLVEETAGTATATITRNAISGNGGLGIDLGNDGVTPNDPSGTWVLTNHDPDGGANELQNFPVIGNASSNGTTVTLNWSLEGSGSNFYRVEFFASPAADASGHGEGQVYLGARDIQTTNGSYSIVGDVFNVAVTPGWVITATATRTDALVPTQFFETSEFSAAVGTATVQGRVLEDVAADGAIAADPGRDGVLVRLYRDSNANNTPDAGDAWVGNATTSGGGYYGFANLATGNYWVVVDSRTFGATGYNASGFIGATAADDVWADQTYGVAGAMDGPGSFLGAAGALYGGRAAGTSDNPFDASVSNSALIAPEHVTRVAVAGANVGNVDSAFSFEVITNTRGDVTDDDATNDRLQQGSLRQFILNSNAISGVQTTEFRLAADDPNHLYYQDNGGAGFGAPVVTTAVTDAGIADFDADYLPGTARSWWRIQPLDPDGAGVLNPLPNIRDTVVFDGTTQPGFNTLTYAPIIELDGELVPQHAAGYGLLFQNGSDGSTVRGMVMNDWGSDALNFRPGADGNFVWGNYFGTDVSGTVAEANRDDGIDFESANNTIGGLADWQRNVVSGNAYDGVVINSATAFGNVVLGNYIGTNAAGTAALGNGATGVLIRINAHDNIVGGTDPDARNIISGNATHGVWIGFGGNPTNAGSNNVVLGNYIGTDVGGTTALGNGLVGVLVEAASNTIGGALAAARNVIAASGREGIVLSNADGALVRNNYIGTDASGAGAAALGNAWEGIQLANGAAGVTIRDNLISGNGRAGIRADDAGTSATIAGNTIGLDATGAIRGNGAALAQGGINIATGAGGFTIGGTNPADRNVISGNTGTGITLDTSTGNVIFGNYIGTDAAGTAQRANTVDGIGLFGATANTIGGAGAGERNVISGNARYGVMLDASSGNFIRGNSIGVDVSGAAALGNGNSGVSLRNASVNNVVGGAGAGNVIGGNLNGVTVEGAGSTGNAIQGNWIGTDTTGTINLGNQQEGVEVYNSAANTLIGGTLAGEGNTIAFNGTALWDGVWIDASSSGNRILRNAIYANAALGIDLGIDGVTANDAGVGDADGGANNLQNYPALASAISTTTQVTVAGTLDSAVGGTFRLEFFANTAADPSGHGEGQRYLGFVDVTDGGVGDLNPAAGIIGFSATIVAPVTPGELIAATATNLATNDTSEFSANVLIVAAQVSITANDPAAAAPANALARAWKGEEARALFGGVAAHGFGDFSHPMSSAVGCALIDACHAYGWAVAKGGSGRITEALAAALAERGGLIETGRRVSSLAELPQVDAVVFDLAPRAVAEIAGERLPARTARAYRRYRHGPAAFKVDFAVEGGVPWAHEPARRAGTVHVGGSFEEVAAAEREVNRGRMPERPFILVGQQYLADPSRSKGDLHPVWSYAHVPSAYDGDATEALISHIERFAPGFRERIAAKAVRTPADFERHNANYVGGDIITGANTPVQTLFRPTLGPDPYFTGAEGLYICSAATPPGAGAHGMSGYNAARSVLKRL